jgi:hypothetical protein
VHREIAKIRRAFFGIEDHGLLACYLDFDFGGSGQGTGGQCLDEPIHDEDGKFVRREGTAYGMQFLAAVMRAAGVESWDKVQGRTVFALRDREGWGGTIIGIAPLPTEPGEEFVFDDLRAKHYPEREPVEA